MLEMKVYDANPHQRPGGIKTIHVSPGTIDKAALTNNDWTDANGDPITVDVRFWNGEAIVTSALGRFLIDKGFARKTRPILTPAYA